MSTPELVAVISAVVAAVGGPPAISAGLRWWFGRRAKLEDARLAADREIALAKIAAVDSDAIREERTIDRLWDRVDMLYGQRDDCTQALRIAEQTRDDCDRERAEQRAHIDTLQAMLKRDLYRDDTGRFELAREASTPVPPALPPVRRRRRGDDDA